MGGPSKKADTATLVRKSQQKCMLTLERGMRELGLEHKLRKSNLHNFSSFFLNYELIPSERDQLFQNVFLDVDYKHV